MILGTQEKSREADKPAANNMISSFWSAVTAIPGRVKSIFTPTNSVAAIPQNSPLEYSNDDDSDSDYQPVSDDDYDSENDVDFQPGSDSDESDNESDNENDNDCDFSDPIV